MAELLLIVVVAQQAYWAWQVQKLINKLMCRNYHEYDSIMNKDQIIKKPLMEVKVSPDEAEDMRILNNLL